MPGPRPPTFRTNAGIQPLLRKGSRGKVLLAGTLGLSADPEHPNAALTCLSGIGSVNKEIPRMVKRLTTKRNMAK